MTTPPLSHQFRQFMDDPLVRTAFYSAVKEWIGRKISALRDVTQAIYSLVLQISKVGIPLIQSNSPALKEPKNNATNHFTTPVSNKFPSPNIKKTRFAEELSSYSPIKHIELKTEDTMSVFFNSHGFEKNLAESLAEGTFFDENGNKITPNSINDLKGIYSVEWPIALAFVLDPDLIYTLIYQGEFDQGTFHGKGKFLKRTSMEKIYTLIEGIFESGVLIAGMIANPDHIIEGKFSEGIQTGKGIIQYPEIKQTDNESFFRWEYHGEFKNALPFGKGKLFCIESNYNEWNKTFSSQIRCVADGVFKGFNIESGCYTEEDGRIFTGNWMENDQDRIFEGTVTHPVQKWSYTGQCSNGIFQGKGLYDNDLLCDLKTYDPETNSILTSKVTVNSSSKGFFFNGTLTDGSQTIAWPDGKTEIQKIVKGKISETEIILPNGARYVGLFKKCTLDGKGIVYDKKGQWVYDGEISCGLPHGKGSHFQEGQTHQGEYLWGNCL